jgi:CRP/FNR family transcriptional regulator, cyclic AMP receptor protein
MHAFGNLDLMKYLPSFLQLQDGTRSSLAAALQHRTCRPGTLVVEAGETASGLYVVISGHVKLLLEDGDGRVLTIGRLGPGEFFGEASVLPGTVHAANVEAEQPCVLAFIPHEALARYVLTNAAATSAMLGTVVARLTAAQANLARLGLKNVYGRVVCIMLESVRESDGEYIVDIGSPEIASRVGASREMVSRVIKDLIERKIVRRRKRKLLVLDRAALADRGAFQRPTFAHISAESRSVTPGVRPVAG